MQSFTTHGWELFIYTTLPHTFMVMAGVWFMILVYPHRCHHADICEDDEAMAVVFPDVFPAEFSDNQEIGGPPTLAVYHLVVPPAPSGKPT